MKRLLGLLVAVLSFPAAMINVCVCVCVYHLSYNYNRPPVIGTVMRMRGVGYVVAQRRYLVEWVGLGQAVRDY